MARLHPARRRQRHGSAVVELAILLPILCFLFAISVDYARTFYFSLTLQHAARNGAYFASNYPEIYSYTTAQQVVAADLTNLDPAPAVNIAYGTESTGPFTSSTPISNGYVEVKVTWTFRSITNFPGMPTNTVLVRTCVMRVAPLTPSFS